MEGLLDRSKMTWITILRVLIGLAFNIFMNWFYPMNPFVVLGVLIFTVYFCGLVNRWVDLFVLINYFVGLCCITG